MRQNKQNTDEFVILNEGTYGNYTIPLFAPISFPICGKRGNFVELLLAEILLTLIANTRRRCHWDDAYT